MKTFKHAVSVILLLATLLTSGCISAYANDISPEPTTASTVEEKEYKSVKAAANSYLMLQPKWSSKRITSVKKGKNLKLIEKKGRWYLVKYGKKTGYVYNRTIKNKKNIKRKKVTKKNYKTFLDDVLFENGTDLRSCYDYVKGCMKYSNSYAHHELNNVKKLKKNEGMLTAESIRTKRGNCLNYSAFLKTLLERAGYECYYAYSHQTKYSVNAHGWVVVKTENGYRHIDAKRKFYLYTDAQLHKKAVSRDLKKIEKNIPACK